MGNYSRLGEQASRTLDMLARNALFGAYTGGATYVNTALTTAGPTISVDDNRSFSAGLVVSVNGTSYTIAGVQTDATNVSQDAALGGVSGSITMTGNVATANGKLGASVQSGQNAFTLDNSQGQLAGQSSPFLTLNMCLQAMAQLEANGVPATTSSGLYRCYVDNRQLIGLYQDPAFQRGVETQINGSELARGVVAKFGGLEFVKTNLSPILSSWRKSSLQGCSCWSGRHHGSWFYGHSLPGSHGP